MTKLLRQKFELDVGGRYGDAVITHQRAVIGSIEFQCKTTLSIGLSLRWTTSSFGSEDDKRIGDRFAIQSHHTGDAA